MSSGSVRPGLPRLVSASISSSLKPVSDRSKPRLAEIGKFEPEQLVVPAGVQGQLVVGND